MIKSLLIVAGLVPFLFACVRPLEQKYYDETAEKHLKAIKKELDSADYVLLESALHRLKAENTRLIDVTFADILSQGKEWAAEQQKLEAEAAIRAEAARKEAIKTAQLNKVVEVVCLEKGFMESHHWDQLTFKFLIKNKSDKNIAALKGEVSFNGIFDEYNTIHFHYDQPINAGQEATWNANTEYIDFMGIHDDLKNKELQDLKYTWKPRQIVFDDGTVIE
ncbi:hypothetical protein [Carboxylicivirga taeanensis]|uniref:hypothetical protein n=1 Tax=Carboxylicivirga taeanensis TaxID=1416875 RepID=UPI003F6DADF7